MPPLPFDPIQYRARTRDHVNPIAQGYATWWATWERDAHALSDRLLVLAQVAPGQRILDVATGLGEPALTAARRVGLTGHVVATDSSAPMLALATARAVASGLQNLTWYELPAEQLNQLDDQFDAVVCRSALMFFPDLVPTLQTNRQRLLPGGRFATSIWSTAQKIPMMSLPQTIIRQHIALPPSAAATPAQARLDGERLAQALTEAGFADVRHEALALTFHFASAGAYIQYTQDVAPHITALLVDTPAAQQAVIWHAIQDAVEQAYSAPDGSIHFPQEAICIVGSAARA